MLYWPQLGSAREVRFHKVFPTATPLMILENRSFKDAFHAYARVTTPHPEELTGT